jgi:hypothetical protein
LEFGRAINLGGIPAWLSDSAWLRSDMAGPLEAARIHRRATVEGDCGLCHGEVFPLHGSRVSGSCLNG